MYNQNFGTVYYAQLQSIVRIYNACISITQWHCTVSLTGTAQRKNVFLQDILLHLRDPQLKTIPLFVNYNEPDIQTRRSNDCIGHYTLS